MSMPKINLPATLLQAVSCFHPSVPGECYTNAFLFVTRQPDPTGWKVVHGVCTGQGSIAGVRFGHAWVEISHNGRVWVYDPTARVCLPGEVYRKVGEVTDTVEYSTDEILRLVAEHDHAGPFDATVAAAVHN